jgi:hypothetical protein
MDDLSSAKLSMMRASVKCLVFGILGLLPAIGLPFALAALWISGRVRLHEKRFWNAGRHCRIVGVVCATLGAVVWTGLAVVVVLCLMLSRY